MSAHPRPYGRALLAFVTLLASLVLSAVPVGSAVLSDGVIGGFQQDGNEIASDGAAGTIDWETADELGTVTVVEDDTADSGFTQGSKELDPGNWACGTGGADPGKANILKAFVNPRVSASDIFLDLAFIRELGDESGGKGDVHLNFEFNQADVGEPGAFAPGPCGIDRRVDDLLITYDYPGGSDAPSIEVYRWAASKGGEWVNNVITQDKVAGAVNDAAIEDPVGGLVTLARQRFGEASLDLESILAPESGDPECISFGSVNVRSRSSGESITSMLQDKLPSWPVDFSTCGGIDLVKTGDGGELLSGAKFQLYLDGGDSIFDDQDDTKVGAECTTDAEGICEWDDLNPGLYFVKETQAPEGYSIDLPDGGVYGPIDLGFRESVSLEAEFVNFKWRYQLNLTPDATNLVGTDHVFTATLEVKKTSDGSWEPAAGETLDIELSGDVGSIVLPGVQCTTDPNGECDIKIHSEDPGDSVLSVSFDDKVTSVAVDAEADATKHWVNYFIDIAADATNLVGTTHTFIVTLERDSGSGPAPISRAHPVVSKVSGPGEFSANTCATAGTNSAGQCTIELTSAVTGVTVVKALYEAAEEEVDNTFSDQATKQWVDYDIVVEPDAVNLVGDEHVFTVTLTRDSGAGFGPLGGADVALEWSGGAGSSLEADSCVTDTAGQCKVTVTSSAPLTGTLTATFGVTLDSGTHSFAADSQKRWVNWALSVTPEQAENLVGTNHTFVVEVSRDEGKGAGMVPLAGAKPTIGLAGKGSVVASTCDAGTDAAGLCTVTITSSEPGLSTVKASFSATEDQASISLSASGQKRWVDYRLTVLPETAVNDVGTTHTFDVKLEKNIGDGFVVAGSETISLGLTGVGSITAVDAGTIASNVAAVCTTDAAGTCRVTITSLVGGIDILQASYAAKVGETARTYTDSGEKNWVAVLGAVELPRTGAALAGQAWLALSLMGTGVALQLAGRRRRAKLPTG